MRLSLLLIMTLALSSCATPVLKELAKEFKHFEDRYSNKGPDPMPVPATYCYSTLGVVTCYDKPMPKDAETQFVGSTSEPMDTRASDEALIKGSFAYEEQPPAPVTVDINTPQYQIQTPAEPAPPPPPLPMPVVEAIKEAPAATPKAEVKEAEKPKKKTAKKVAKKKAAVKEAAAAAPVMPKEVVKETPAAEPVKDPIEAKAEKPVAAEPPKTAAVEAPKPAPVEPVQQVQLPDSGNGLDLSADDMAPPPANAHEGASGEIIDDKPIELKK